MVSNYRCFYWFQWRFLISDGEQLQMFLLVSMEVSDIWWWATTDVFIDFNGGFWYLMVSNYRCFYWFQWRFLISDGEQLQMFLLVSMDRYFHWFQWRFLISDGEQLQMFLLVSMEISDIWWWATTDIFIDFNGGFWYLMVCNYRCFYWFQWRFLISDGEQLQMFLLVSMEVSDIWWWATTDVFIGFNGGFWYLMVSNYRCFYWFQWRFLISDGERLHVLQRLFFPLHVLLHLNLTSANKAIISYLHSFYVVNVIFAIKSFFVGYNIAIKAKQQRIIIVCHFMLVITLL